MEIIIRITQLLLSLSLLVLLHELGHFLAARLFKTRVDKFYLFFNPWFSLFKVKKGETEYGLGWLPLGGYVKIAGMIDESMDKEQMQKSPKPDEFRSKKTWQRLIIILAGVIVNIVLAFIIYIGISYTWGERYLPNESLKYGVVVDDFAYEAGFRNGDKILSIDGEVPDRFSAIVPKLLIDNSRTATVLRGKDTVVLEIGEQFQKNILKASSKSFSLEPPLSPRILFSPFVVGKTKEGSPAAAAGVQKGDTIVGINGVSFLYYDEFQDFLKKHTEKTITIQIKRESEKRELALVMTEKPMLGIYSLGSKYKDFELKHMTYSFSEAVSAGLHRGWSMFSNYITSLKLIFTKEGAGSVGGLGTMAQIFPTFWSWQIFWETTAMLSIMFAFLNVLPIPGLDGGHAIFILYEMITGRKPGLRFMEITQTIGILFLIFVILYANVNDLFKFLG